MTRNSSNDAIINSLELERTRLHQAHPEWTRQQLQQAWSYRTQNIMSYLNNDSGVTPRSMQSELVQGAGQMPGYDWSLGATDLDLPNNTIDSSLGGFASIPMARATLSTPSCLGHQSTLPSSSSNGSSTGGGSVGSKRGHHYVDMDYSASYTFGLPPAQQAPPFVTASMIAQNLDVETYDPAEYINNRLMSDLDLGAMQSVVKKQKIDCSDAECPTADASSFGMHPMFSMVSSAAATTPLSSCSLAPSETMRRQNSSSTCASLVDAADMLRLSSVSSYASDLPLVEESLQYSFLSCSTEKPSADQSLSFSFLGAGDDFSVLDDVDCNLAPHAIDREFYGALNDDSRCVQASAAAQTTCAEPMQRSTSNQSTSSTASSAFAKQKTIDRQRRHLENGKRDIAIRSLPSGPTSTSTATAAADSSARAPLQPHDAKSKRKEPIARAAYTRPQRPRRFCDQCSEHKEGFKGEHELRRHQRAHAAKRKVWLVTEPAAPTEFMPKEPVGICKDCKNQKTYNVDYNGAAHLRRRHFVPCKRGRKAKGESRESRAGKAGGDFPSMDWLKDNGWLTEVEIDATPAQAQAPVAVPVPVVVAAAAAAVAEDARPSVALLPLNLEQQRLTADALGFGGAFRPLGDDLPYFGY